MKAAEFSKEGVVAGQHWNYKSLLLVITCILVVSLAVAGGCGPRPPEAVPPTPPAPEVTPPTSPPPTAPEEAKPEGVPSEVTEMIEFRGLNVPQGTPEGVEWELDQAQAMGANWVAIVHEIYVSLEGEPIPPGPGSWTQSEEEILSFIRAAHNRGLKVWLVIRTPLGPLVPGEEQGEFTFELNPALFSGLSSEAADRLLENLELIALEWAEIAEREKVEMFTPIAAGQLALVLYSPRAFSFTNSLLPEVREVYSGDLAQKIDLDPGTAQLSRMGAGVDESVFSFDGWDYVTADVMGLKGLQGGPVRTYEDWREGVRQLIYTTHMMNEKFNTKGIILGPEILAEPGTGIDRLTAGTEFWGQGELSDQEIETAKVKLWEILLEETLGKVDGYFFWIWAPGESNGVPLMVEKEVNGLRYIGRQEHSQGEGPMKLIQRYYTLPEEEMDKFIERNGEDALQAIERAGESIAQAESLAEEAGFLDALRNWLAYIEGLFKEGRYVDAESLAQALSNFVSDFDDARLMADQIQNYDIPAYLKEEGVRQRLAQIRNALISREYVEACELVKSFLFNPFEIVDGDFEEWRDVEPTALDPVGDSPSPDCDLVALYLMSTADSLYGAITLSSDNPKVPVHMFISSNDTHYLISLEPGQSIADVSYWYPDRVEVGELSGELSVSYGEIIEFKLPLDAIGNPRSIIIGIHAKTENLEDADTLGPVEARLGTL